MATPPSSPLKAMRGLVGRLLGRAEAAADNAPLEENGDVDQDAARPIDREAMAQRVAAEQLAQNRSKSSELPKGRQFVVLFDVAAEHFGARWPKLINRAKLFAENVLEARLGDRFAMREDDDDGVTFVILDKDLSEEDIGLLGQSLIEAIQRRLTGGDDAEEPDLSRPDAPEIASPDITPAEVPLDQDDEIEIPNAEAISSEKRSARVDYGADSLQPEFADGWEFERGPDQDGDAGISEDRPLSEAGAIEGSGDGVDDALSIPISSEREVDEAQWGPTEDILEAPLETPLAGERDDAVIGEFASEDLAQTAFEFGPSDDVRDEGTASIPTADDLPTPEFETPIAVDRPDQELAVPTTEDRGDDPPALLEGGGEGEDRDPITPISGAREAAETPIPYSEDRSEVIAEFASTDALAEGAFDIPTSDDLADREPEFGQSETRDEAEFDVPVSGYLPLSEPPLFATSDQVVEDVGEHATSQNRNEPQMGDFGQSETREEDALVVPLSDSRVDLEVPGFGQSETIAEQPFEVPLSQDRASEPSQEFGTTDTRDEPAFAVPVSEDRETPLMADFGQSETKPDEDYAVPISKDPDEPGQADFGQSETRPENAYDVPLSEERESDSQNIDFGRSETRAEAEFEVPISEDRDDKLLPDFGRSETREENGVEVTVEQTTERQRPDVVYVSAEKSAVDAPEPTIKTKEELPLEDVRLRYGAWLDARTDVVTTYLADPCTRRHDGSETQYHHLLGDGPSPERCFMLDCLMLEQANAQISLVLAEGGHMILGLPIAATTLARPRYRAEYLRRFKTVDESTRKMTRLIAYQLPQTSASQASDLFGWLRSIARPPIVRVPPRLELLAPLAAHGVYGVSINFGKWMSELGDDAFSRRLHRITQQAHLVNLRVAATNLPDRKAIETAVTLGADLIEIKILESAASIPRRLVKIDRAALLRKI